MMAKIGGGKDIADYIYRATGLSCSQRTIYRYTSRPSDPMPVQVFNGRVTIDSAELDKWIAGNFKSSGRRRMI